MEDVERTVVGYLLSVVRGDLDSANLLGDIADARDPSRGAEIFNELLMLCVAFAKGCAEKTGRTLNEVLDGLTGNVPEGMEDAFSDACDVIETAATGAGEGRKVVGEYEGDHEASGNLFKALLNITIALGNCESEAADLNLEELLDAMAKNLAGQD